jgi:hypothetical protein
MRIFARPLSLWSPTDSAPSMYQSELRLLTVSGETLRTLIERALGPPPESFPREGDTTAVLVAVRATGHHEHHASAGAALRRNAARTPYDKYAQSHATEGTDGCA